MRQTILINIIIVILSFSNLTNASAQDYIVKIDHKTNTLQGEKLVLENDSLTFKDAKNGNIYKLSSDDIYNINFQINGQAEIIIQSLTFDTIECQLASISPSTIYYRQENQLLKSINKDEVFGVFFNADQNVVDIEKYKKNYIRLHKALNNEDLKIIRKNGEVIDIIKLNSIDSIKANITIISNNVEITTFINISEIDGIVLKELLAKKSLKSNKTFIFSKQNNWYLVRYIEDIKPEYIGININNNQNEIVSINQQKENINGIFFSDYRVPIYNNSNNIDIANQYTSSKHKFVKIDVNYGIGYSLAKAPEGISSEVEKYIDDLRSGFVLDANFKVFPISGFGIGLKFNQYKTSNSIESAFEDNIKISFIGLTLSGNSKFKNNRGYGYFDFSIGSIKEVNNAKVLNQSFDIEGSTIGIYFSSGVDFLISENISIGFQCGLMAGEIDEFKVNDEKGIITESENLLRIDGVVGLKIYL